MTWRLLQAALPLDGKKRYDGTGLLAVDPQAFFMMFDLRQAPENVETEVATVVSIRGPLCRLASSWDDSYEAIQARFAAAFAAGPPNVVMRMDSPGGDMAGCCELARHLRAASKLAGKRLYAFVDGKAASAGYVLASAADEIVVTESALVGSVGVIQVRPDWSQQNERMGLRIAFVTSGSHKADGYPDMPISKAELEETQQLVDAAAATLFEVVGEHRKMAPELVAAVDARVLYGKQAVAAGFADRVQDYDAFLAELANPNKEQAMKYKDARAALETIAKEDSEEGRSAKRALAAMDAKPEGEGGEEKKPEDGATEGGEEAGAEGDDCEPGAEGDDKEPAAEDGDSDEDDKDKKPPAGADAGAQALAEVRELSATIKKDRVAAQKATDAAERARLIASRPDLNAETVKTLKAAPLATVRSLVASLPRGRTPKPVITTAPATRGASQTENVQPEHKLSSNAKRSLDARMGMLSDKPNILRTEHKLSLGYIPPVQSLSEALENDGQRD